MITASEKVQPNSKKAELDKALSQSKPLNCSTTPGGKTTSIRDHVLYKYKDFSGIDGGNRLLEFNNSADKKVIGVQNYVGNKLQRGEVFAVSEISIGLSKILKATGFAGKFGDHDYNESFPSLVRNSTFYVIVNGKIEYEMLMTEFDTRTTGNNVEDQYVPVLNKFRIPQDTDFQFEIRTADGTNLSDIYLFQIRLKGQLAVQS